VNIFACCFLFSNAQAATQATAETQPSKVRSFPVTGVVREIGAEHGAVVVAHETIPNYMRAMTMPFNVRDKAQLDGIQPGDKISFRLQVTETESWIDRISKIGTAPAEQGEAAKAQKPATDQLKSRHPLMDYHFTNELGQAVTLGDFHGQALAITFFFTRCPIPEFCPRLSKNFEEASQKLLKLPNAPTNWHFLSVTFDPKFDTPSVLKSYGERYQYDPQHWSFLTGPLDKIQELADQSNVTFEHEAAFYNHNFRTLIIDPAGHLQMVFPTSGDLSDAITSEMLKAMSPTNRAS